MMPMIIFHDYENIYFDTKSLYHDLMKKSGYSCYSAAC